MPSTKSSSAKKSKPAKAALNAAKRQPRQAKRASRPRKIDDHYLYLIDSDRDGLSDYQEKLYGTDPFKPDTDGDGLSDYEEIKIFRSNPLDPDTNKNGIPDGEEVRRGRNPSGKGSLKDIFLGTSGNSYMPGMLRKDRIVYYGAVAVFIKIIIVCFIVLLPLSAWVTPDVLSEQSRQIIALTNELRKNAGVGAVLENPKLSQAAYDKVQDMLAQQYFSHTGPDGKVVSDWLRKNLYDFDFVGENLAIGFSSPADVINAWSKSATHYANMVDPNFSEIGVAMVVGDYQKYETTFVAEMLATPKVAGAVSASASNTITRLPVKKSTKSVKTVLGLKSNAPLGTPVLISPEAGSILKSIEIKIKIYAPQAQIVSLMDNDVEIFTAAVNQDDFTLEENISLGDGVHKLSVLGISGTEQASSTPTKLTIDSQPPTLESGKTQVFVMNGDDSDQKLVRAVAYLSPDTTEAIVSFNNYQIKLQPTGNTNEWAGSVIIFNQDEAQVFNPVVLPVLAVKDQAGNAANYDIAWNNVVPVKTSVIKQYFWAKSNDSKFSWLFTLGSLYYKILLVIIVAVFAYNLYIQTKNNIAHFNYKFFLGSFAFIAFIAVMLLI